MALQFKVVARKNPIDKTVRFYPSLETQHPQEKSEFLDRLEKRSTLSSADVKGALDALEYELKQALLGGNGVRLGDLGSFHLTLKCKGERTADKVTAQHIRRVRVQFRPSAALMRDMQPANVGKARFIQRGAYGEAGE